MKPRSLLLILAILVCGCEKPARSPSAPTVLAPTPSAAPTSAFTVSGIVFEATVDGIRPATGVELAISVEDSPAPGTFRYYQAGKVRSDARGRYEISGLPAGLVWIDGGKPPAAWEVDRDRYMQPCAAAVRVAANTTFDLELVAVADPRPSTLVRPLTISGTVFETTAAGRVPVGGVRIFAEKPFDFVASGVISDANGRYLLCGLPPETWSVTTWKDGYDVWSSGLFPLSSNRTLDIEIRRH